MKSYTIPRYVILILFLLSCSASQFGWKEGPVTGKNESSGFIEDFDPLTLNDDDIVIDPVDQSEQSESTIQSQLDEIPSEQEAIEKEMVQGYRVQLLVSRDEERAIEEKKKAIFQFPEVGVYMVFETPYYKIRIGDCQSEKEAEQLKNEAIRKGFNDAWQVPSKVYRKTNMSSDL
ncbi:SPOR domain-containing protein [bacterium]|nr:SPOR domain-containing protein [bacterium]